ncbi:MAG: hypothetical protein V4529_05640 [Gemmatimonadota bacterium]
MAYRYLTTGLAERERGEPASAFAEAPVARFRHVPALDGVRGLFVLPRIGYFAGDPATATYSYCLYVVYSPFIMVLDLLVPKFRIARMYA